MNKELQSRQIRDNILWRVGRMLLGLAALLLVVLVITLVAGAMAKSNLKAHYPPPGMMVDVGGYRLHIYCEGRGSPTVIMESGLGDSSLIWALVRPESVKRTRTCVYDRAGLGWSEPSPRPRTAATIVEELHTLLVNGDIAGPYVLVGHSIGGAYVRLYAHNYPESVVGMVLVDSSHEAQSIRLPAAIVQLGQQGTAAQQRELALYKPLARMGVLALAHTWLPANPMLPVATQATEQALIADPKYLDTLFAEQNSAESNLAEVAAAQIKSVGNIPLIVLSAGKHELPGGAIPPELVAEMAQVWQQLQAELAALSPQGKQVVVAESGHYIHLEQPQVVIDAINEVVAAALE
ncbi:MAG: alpha/beta hydrolase [Caldilineaceae bacterium]|nr:alpha/beta hydrolase [Caldilineaceae bacterium]